MNQRYYLFCIIFFISFYSQAKNIYHVKADATFKGNALTWESASNDLSEILMLAVAGDEVWVAEGVYVPKTKKGFSVSNGVKVYGGFPNTGNPTKESRNYTLYKTVLSGDMDHNDKNSDGNFIAETATDIIGENCVHLIMFKNANSQTFLSGFIITAGQANGEEFPENVGGAILNEGAYTSKISNPTLQECIFSGNFAASYGGAVYNYGAYGNAKAFFQNCNFIGNAAYQGGAIANDAYKGKSSSIFQNCIFTENTADDGGAIYNYGELGSSSPSFENCDFIRNKAQTGVGAAVYNYGEKGESLPTFSDCFFLENTAKAGSDVVDYQNADFETMENADNVEIISVYPNPSVDNITIFNPYAEKMEIEIRHISGQEMMKTCLATGEKFLYSMENVQNGIYTILAKNENKALHYSQKVVKQ